MENLYNTFKNNQQYYNYKLSSAGIAAGLFGAYKCAKTTWQELKHLFLNI